MARTAVRNGPIPPARRAARILALLAPAATLLILAACSAGPRPSIPGPVVWSEFVPPETETQDVPDLSASPLKLGDVLRAALTANAGLQAAEHNWQAARLVPEQVSSYPDPRLTLNRYIDEVVTRNGAIEWQAMLMQMIPFPGKLGLKGDIAEQDARVAWEKYMAAGLTLAAEVKKAYYELYWVRHALRITKENKNLLEQLLEVARTKYAAAQVTQQDVLKAQMDLARLSEDLNSMEDMARMTRARLNRTLNRPADTPLGDPPGIEIEPFEEDIARLTDEALKHRPELRSADHMIRKREHAESLAELSYLPDFSLSAMYSVIEDTSLMGAPDPGQDAWGFGLGIDLPIWLGRRDAAVRESRERLDAARLARRQLEHDTRYQVTHLYYRLQIAFRQVKLYRDNLVPQARQSLKVAQTGYSAVPPKVDFESLIDNQRRLLMFQVTLERSRADFQQRMADLERIVGHSLSEAK